MIEINNNVNEENKQKVLSMTNKYASKFILLTEGIKTRAIALKQYGLKSFDSLHLAAAESANVDVLLTVDDKFIKAANRSDTTVKVINPVKWLLEV